MRTTMPIAVVLLLSIALAGCTPTASTSARADPGPYPECPVILEWLRENAGDPRAVEVVRWGKRTEKKAETGTMNVNVLLKYRFRNPVGAMAVQSREFFLIDSKVISATVVDWD